MAVGPFHRTLYRNYKIIGFRDLDLFNFDPRYIQRNLERIAQA
jgi:hypothetical protein